jgi:hypothetical protein
MFTYSQMCARELFYSPEGCSLAPHIVLRELRLAFDLVGVNQATKVTLEGENYLSISPCGYVAALKHLRSNFTAYDLATSRAQSRACIVVSPELRVIRCKTLAEMVLINMQCKAVALGPTGFSGGCDSFALLRNWATGRGMRGPPATALILKLQELAGFDGVALHGAFGLILFEFMSPLLNDCTDRFGGNVDNRTRLTVEVIEGIRRACGPDFQVGWRLSVERP